MRNYEDNNTEHSAEILRYSWKRMIKRNAVYTTDANMHRHTQRALTHTMQN